MIVPSIDLMDGRAVQLRRGKELVLDGGDPLVRLREFAVAGEVAVVDLDAALGRGSNQDLIRRMVRLAPCRVGGGIRDVAAARRWLDAGARKVMLGTAAEPALLAQLPKERVIVAVDASGNEVVVNGWRTRTGREVLATIAQLAPYVGGFLLTQIEHEGGMAGFDRPLIEAAVAASGGARLTAAGGITTADDVAWLDRIGADGQVGMALYTGRLALADAVMAPLPPPADGLWPTVVCEENGRALGLAWSNQESLRRAVTERRGIYWSRSRRELWIKGATSGNGQELVRVDLDCDRDTLRFVVRQQGAGFCHRGTRSCWGTDFDLDALERTMAVRRAAPAESSNTARLLAEPDLLSAKLREEAAELAGARSPEDVVEEAADVLYFMLAKLAAQGVTLQDVRGALERRSLRVTRRPMRAKD